MERYLATATNILTKNKKAIFSQQKHHDQIIATEFYDYSPS